MQTPEEELQKNLELSPWSCPSDVPATFLSLTEILLYGGKYVKSTDFLTSKSPAETELSFISAKNLLLKLWSWLASFLLMILPYTAQPVPILSPPRCPSCLPYLIVPVTGSPSHPSHYRQAEFHSADLLLNFWESHSESLIPLSPLHTHFSQVHFNRTSSALKVIKIKLHEVLDLNHLCWLGFVHSSLHLIPIFILSLYLPRGFCSSPFSIWAQWFKTNKQSNKQQWPTETAAYLSCLNIFTKPRPPEHFWHRYWHQTAETRNFKCIYDIQIGQLMCFPIWLQVSLLMCQLSHYDQCK